MASDGMNALDNALLREVVQFAGEENYLSVALTCRRFNQTYRELYDTRKTSAEEMVQTVSGAKMFLRETNQESRFCIKNEKDIGPSRIVRRLSQLEFVRDAAALNGRLEVLQWAVAQGCPLQEPETFAFAAYGGNLAMLQWLQANLCRWDRDTCAAAAQNGNLPALQWARANNFPWAPRRAQQQPRMAIWLFSNGPERMVVLGTIRLASGQLRMAI